MLSFECELLVIKFVFIPEKYPEGNRLRLVPTEPADLFTLDESLSHCGIGTISGQLTDVCSTGAFEIANNQDLAHVGLPFTLYCNQGYSGVVISQSGYNNGSKGT